jgi:hypothetical protein
MIANYASVYLVCIGFFHHMNGLIYSMPHAVHNHSLGCVFRFDLVLSLTQLAFLRRFGVSAEPVLGTSFRPIGRKIIERLSSNSLTRSSFLRLAWWQFWRKVSWLLDTGSCARSYHCVGAQLLIRSRTKNKFITFILFFFITVAVRFLPSSAPLNSELNRL